MARGAWLELVVFDMAGTTVDDVIDGVPLVLRSYDDAFRRFGVEVPMEVLNEQRGRDKLTVIRELGGDRAAEIFDAFVETLMENTGRVREMEGAGKAFRFLRGRGVKVALNTGFPADVAQGIIEYLGWAEAGLIDDWICSEMVGRSRPDPAMVTALMERLGVEDPSGVMKVDDTVKGIEEGMNAGVATIGVLSGTQSRERLLRAGPTDVIPGVGHLPQYLVDKGYL
jgi:phosphonatase-like hydrolase